MCVDCVEFVEFKGSKSEMAQPVSSPGKRSNNGGTTHCFADSSSASRRWINSGSGSALAAKKLRALTQIHSEDEPHSVAPNLPPKPSKLGRRMSFSNNPGTKLTAMSKGADKVPEKCRRHSDASGKPGPRGKLFGHFDNNSNCVGNPRFCSPSLCFAGSKPQSEDGQGEVSNVGTKGKHGNVSDELPVSGEHSERIMVYVRVRPLSKKEEEAGARNCVCVSNNRDLYLNDSVNENDYLRSKRDCGRHYRFDAVFPESVGQQEVYNTSVAELVDGVLQGRNASVLCYGATGAGKTYTMLGTVGSPGVMVIAIKDLFAKLEQLSFNSEHVVCISYLEVYNEAVKDLLSPGKALVLREDKQGNVSAGLTQHNTYSAEEVMTLLHRGNQNRATEATRMNETSSRSHAILQVVLEYKLKEASTTVIRTGKLSLVDLAGSERATATDQLTVRSVEGASINKSLLALSSCIRALVDQKKHVPYRLSKLTQLLKDSLGGACQTAMIANISPSSTSYSETQNTLHWANRAKEIRTKSSTANEELEIPDSQIEMTKQLLESQKQNEELRMQVAQLEQRLLAVESQKLTSSPSFPCSSPNLPSPFTPPATVHLRRGIQDLKEESDHMKTEYSFQLKHKDDVIRKLYKMGSGVEQMIQNNVSVPTSADVSVIQPSETLTPKKPTRTTISAPQNDYDSPYYRRSRFSDVGLKSPSPSPSPYRKLSLSGTEKKRPFGDITNDTTGTESRGKMDTSDPPSMLLKPGFYGEPPNC